MHGIILAAGMGSRLGKSIPKGLLILPNKETILSRQVRIMKEAGVENINIVVGHMHELIEEKIGDVNYSYNPRYSETNTAKSLLCGIEGVDDDVLWMNGDVVFDEEIIPMILKQGGNAILVNRERCGEEEVKYIADENEIIKNISKQIINAHGEALGVNLISKQSLDKFRAALDQCRDNDYFEHALQAVIDQGEIFKTVSIDNYNCIEIDFAEDWATAQSIFKSSD